MKDREAFVETVQPVVQLTESERELPYTAAEVRNRMTNRYNTTQQVEVFNTGDLVSL